MPTRTLTVTRSDRERLLDLIRASREARSEEHKHLAALEQELGKADVVEPADVPADVVTMNSTVRLRVVGERQVHQWTLVYPHEADVEEGRLSVLAPLGTALLGYRAGDTFEWDVPAGRRRYRIMEIVHQPEAAGVPEAWHPVTH